MHSSTAPQGSKHFLRCDAISFSLSAPPAATEKLDNIGLFLLEKKELTLLVDVTADGDNVATDVDLIRCYWFITIGRVALFKAHLFAGMAA